MHKITEERLLKAGWNEKRKINISSIKEKYLEAGIIMPKSVEDFLSAFGMLVFNDIDRKEDLEFVPEKALGCNLDKRYFEKLLEEYDINEMVYPVGITCRGNLMVLMTAQHIFYCFIDGYLEKAGESIEEMLDCLVGECSEAVEIE
ncbi:MAG: SUKH-3 domain-containing protein [Clostridium sp.]|nr:SUKH-3 domain-containing protein [Clostridium sp.]